jgi:putative MATE family efflux protein
VAENSSRIDMTTGALPPKLARLSWPLVAGNLLQTLYNLADIFWVGRVGTEAVAAVSLMFPMLWLFVSVAMGLTAAANAVVSQHVGAGDDRAAEVAVGQTTLLAVAVAVALAAGGYLFRGFLVRLIGAEGAVYRIALSYLEVILVAIPFTFLFFVFRAVLRAAGDTRTAMWLVVASAGLNVVIDPVFVLGFGPVEGMGARGAAVATLVSRVVAALVGVYILLDGGWGIRLRPADLRPDPAVLRRLVDVGYPGTLDGLARSFFAVAFAGLVARFGAVPTAAYGIGIRYMSVTWTVAGAVGQATGTGVGQNLGAGSPERAREVTRIAMLGTMGLLFGVGALLFAFPDEAMSVFIDDAAVVDAGVDLLRIVAFSLAFFGGLTVVQGGFRGAGNTREAFLLSLLSRWGFRIPVGAALAFLLGWGAVGLWWGHAVGSTVSFFLGVAWFARGTWRRGVVDRDADEGTAQSGDAADSTATTDD